MERIKILINADSDHVCIHGENLTVLDLAATLMELIEDGMEDFTLCCESHIYDEDLLDELEEDADKV